MLVRSRKINHVVCEFKRTTENFVFGSFPFEKAVLFPSGSEYIGAAVVSFQAVALNRHIFICILHFLRVYYELTK